MNDFASHVLTQADVTLEISVIAAHVGNRRIELAPHVVHMLRVLAKLNLVEAIRFMRAEYDLGLREAKMVVDRLRELPQR